MPAADTARLIASLELKDKFSPGMKKVFGTLDQAESRFGAIGQKATAGVANFTKNVALIGVAAAGGIALAVRSGLSDLAELETAITSVDGAIAQLGLTGQLTGKQVAGWANDIERDVGAAFDDKAITAAAATLLRFGKVAPKNLKPALTVMTDLATKTGDIESAAALLSKALADPGKAAGKLARAGVILTKAQQDQIKAMLEVNDVAGAQALILAEVEKSTKGAALASQGPYARSLAILADVGEDARKALAEGFLPVIQKVADKLGKAVADPKFINGIREFGTELAGGLDDLISIAEKLPWSTIGESLRIAGAGAKAVLTAFTSLPPWIQTAVITGWGLNKLTGGALGGIISELGKGLIKGVLGINAGVVNIKAATVTGAGGAVAGAGAAGGGGAKGAVGKVIGAVGKVFIVGAVAGLFAELTGQLGDVQKENAATTAAVKEQGEKFAKSASLTEMKTALQGLLEQQRKLVDNPLTAEGIAYALNVHDVATTINGEIARLQSAIVTSSGQNAKQLVGATERAEAIATQKANEIKAAQVAAAQLAAGDSRSERTAIAAAASAQAAAQARTTEAARSAAAAIRDKDLSVSVKNYNTISTSVTVRETIDSQTTFKSYNRYQS
jgi:hypothetical protein